MRKEQIVKYDYGSLQKQHSFDQSLMNKKIKEVVLKIKCRDLLSNAECITVKLFKRIKNIGGDIS